jgi:hypothetical protein
LYQPVAAAKGQRHSLVLSATGLTDDQLLRLAAHIIIGGRLGELRSSRHLPRPRAGEMISFIAFC